MKTTETVREADLEKADTECVLRHAFDRTPLEAEVARRVHERAAKVTDEIRRVHGIIDDNAFDALLHEEDDA